MINEKKLISIFAVLLLLLSSANVVASESGWTVVEPAEDSRIIYVSSSSGRDILGKAYKLSEISDFENPGQIRPFKTLKAAAGKLRAGYPDILLLKRGDEWTLDETLELRGGRSANEKMTIMAYGPDDRRPKINTSVTVFRIFEPANNIAIIGLHLYAHKRDPASEHFAGWESIGSPSGIGFYSPEATMHSYLIEDNRINYFDGGITFTGPAKYEDIVIRRNVIQNSYNTSEHAQGIYASLASIVLEENVLDHNGWYQQRFAGGGGPDEGQATIFNHNTYFGNAYDTLFRNNLFLRASSIHNKWTSEPNNPQLKQDSIMSRNLRMENNFYYGGEVGISIGGNTDFNNGHRWQNVSISDNVMLAIGKNQPTMRNIGWYIDISDWNGGKVCGNYLLHNDNQQVDNLKGIHLAGHVADVSLIRNTMTGLHMNNSYAAAISIDDFPKKNIVITQNRLQFPHSRIRMIDDGRSFDGKIADNSYYGKAETNQWFMHSGVPYGIESWRQMSGDLSSSVSRVKFSDNPRTLDSYLQSIGLSGQDEFFDKVAEQSRQNWDERLTAKIINAYLREGYGNLRCEAE